MKFKNLLLQNSIANFNQTRHKASLDEAQGLTNKNHSVFREMIFFSLQISVMIKSLSKCVYY